MNPFKTRFISRIGDQINFFPIENISYFYAESTYVFLMTKSFKSYIVDLTLEQIERDLDPHIFFRINRGFIVSIQSIANISKYFNSRLELELKPISNEEVIVSRPKCKLFMEWIDR